MRILRPGQWWLGTGVLLSMAAAAAVAQYTPGSGGYVQPPPPQQPQQSGYSWETPAGPSSQYPPPQYAQQPTYGQPAYGQQGYDPQAQYGQPAPQYDQYGRIIPPPPPPPVLSDAQVGDLTASIALYPDPLLAQMLPGSAYVQELAYADKWLAQHPGADEGTLQQLPLSPTTKALMHYPAVLTLMADHLDWTQSVGIAFTYQRGDVMQSIQRWRMTAMQYGTLTSTPQQQVVYQDNVVMIQPPPEVQTVYVPVYDPRVVYVRPMHPERVESGITFRAGGVSIQWLQGGDVDWRRHEVRRRDDDHRYDDRYDDRRGGTPPPRPTIHQDTRTVEPPKGAAPRDPGRNVRVIDQQADTPKTTGTDTVTPPTRGNTRPVVIDNRGPSETTTNVPTRGVTRPTLTDTKPPALKDNPPTHTIPPQPGATSTADDKPVSRFPEGRPGRVSYPEKIVTPTPDKKVVSLPSTPPAAPATTPPPVTPAKVTPDKPAVDKATPPASRPADPRERWYNRGEFDRPSH